MHDTYDINLPSETERRLGISWVNIAKRGTKSHPGKILTDNFAIVIFDRMSDHTTIVALWDLSECQAATSIELPFLFSEVWEWDDRSEELQAAMTFLSNQIETTLDHQYESETITPRM